ncbi:hypothetical protein [uncultured Thiodictyon sp.]|jgi:hypothetical protein|nr:hypothetical protein [uncultured Thiodictyon sp.]
MLADHRLWWLDLAGSALAGCVLAADGGESTDPCPSAMLPDQFRVVAAP